MKNHTGAYVLAVVLAILSPRVTDACSCPDPGGQTLLNRAVLVFTGEAVRAVIVDGGGVGVVGRGVTSKAPAVVVTLRVHGVWKGVVPAELPVWTLAGPPGVCGVEFRLGEKYLVFAARDASDPRWFAKTDLCGGTGHVRAKATRRHLEQLGPPRKTLPVEAWWGDVLDLQ